MKKFLIGSLVLLLLSLVCVYLVIPPKITVSSIATVNANVNSAQRYISDKPGRSKWWPRNGTIGLANTKHNISSYEGFNFQIPLNLFNASTIFITGNNKDINSSITFLKLTIDTTLIQWQ